MRETSKDNFNDNVTDNYSNGYSGTLNNADERFNHSNDSDLTLMVP